MGASGAYFLHCLFFVLDLLCRYLIPCRVVRKPDTVAQPFPKLMSTALCMKTEVIRQMQNS